MENKTINLELHQNFKSRLIEDADKLESQVDEDLRRNIFAKISKQPIDTTPAIENEKHYWNISKIAIAASIILSIPAIQLFNSGQDNLQPEQLVLEQKLEESSKTKNELMVTLAKLDSNKLLNSKHLQTEYLAILSDMEKIKDKIIKI